MMKKIAIITFFLIIVLTVSFLAIAKHYPKKSQNIEIKSENADISNEPENNSSSENSENTEPSEVKIEDNINITSDDSKKTEQTVPDATLEAKKEVSITNKLVSFGYGKADSRKIDTIIIHSSYNAMGGDKYDVDGLIKEYKSYGVSSHYLIDRKGKTYQLVADKNIAYHAGVSKVPDGRTNVNDFSLGIEMMNTEEGKYTDEQYSALKSLIANLKNKYKIKYVLGHNQIAPGRKTDPWNFDWGKI